MTWQKRLEPFGDAWLEFDYRAFTALSGMSDAELRQIVRDCHKPDQTNVWFATYHAAPHVLELARHILYDRERKATQNPRLPPAYSPTAPSTKAKSPSTKKKRAAK